MKKNIFLLLILIFSLTTFSCVYGTNNFLYWGNQVDKRVDYIHELNDFENKIDSKENPLSSKYKILVITDTHFGSPHKETETEPFIKWLNSVPKKDLPKFCLILGDNVDQGYENEYKEYCDFKQKIENKGIPVITLLGNHDLYNSGWEYFVDNCYPCCSIFHFDTKGFSWYGIDTGTGDLGIKQYKMLKKQMENDNKPKIVICHYPLTNSKWMGAVSFHDSSERNLLVNLYSKNKVSVVLCGHLHKIDFADLGSFREYGHPSFCYSDPPAWTLYEVDESNLEKPIINQLPRNF